MKSGKQRKREIKAAREARRTLRAVQRTARAQHDVRFVAGEPGLPVAVGELAPDNSYGIPAFVLRGCYVPVAFSCKDCGAQCVWTAKRQKWWYEVAKGSPWSTAVRCAPCRAARREQRAAHRVASLIGLLNKNAERAARAERALRAAAKQN